MSLVERVARVDLSPEFSGAPLSATRIRDYFHLLGDLLYFPQRTRAYVADAARSMHAEQRAPRTLSLAAWRQWAHSSPVQIEFLIMVAVICTVSLVVILHLAAGLSALAAGQTMPLDSVGVSLIVGLIAVLLMLGIGVAGGEPGALAPFALPAGVAMGLVWLLAVATRQFGLHDGRAGVVVLVIFAGAALGMASAAWAATATVAVNGVRAQALTAALLALALTFAAGFFGRSGAGLFSMAGDLVVIGVAAFAGALAAALRIDDYAKGARRPGPTPADDDWAHLSHVTPIPLSHLHDHLTRWLDADWRRGLDNAASIWLYTAQQETVHRALHEVMLAVRTPVVPKSPTDPHASATLTADERRAELVVELISVVADNPDKYPWDMLAWSESTRPLLPGATAQRDATRQAEKSSAAVLRSDKRRRKRQRAFHEGIPVRLPDDTPEKAVTAGFWYLEHGYIDDARAAFNKAPASPLTREMQSLVSALYTLSGEENLLIAHTTTLPERPKEPHRTESWDALDKVRTAIRYGQMARHSYGEDHREHALAECARMLQELRAGPPTGRAEVRHLRHLAELWEAEIEDLNGRAEARRPLKPTPNPFVFTEPLRNQKIFVGRKHELAGIHLAWTSGNLQPILLHGMPQVGKTTLLYQAEATNSQVRLAWLNMALALGGSTTTDQALAALRASVRQASLLDLATPHGASAPSSTPAPVAALPSDPWAQTEQSIRQVCSLQAPRNLILVLDDFDAALSIFAGDGEMERYLAFIEHLCESVTNFNVVFVSQRTPAGFAQRFGRKFEATTFPLEVGMLERKALIRLLRPDALPVFFGDDAVESMWRLTGGHPYLAQLLAHGVVQRFNRAALGGQGEPLILSADIDASLAEPAFQQRCAALFARTQDVLRIEAQNSAAPNTAAAALSGDLWQQWSDAEGLPKLAAGEQAI